MCHTSSISTIIALTVVSLSSAGAADPQKGPAFYTDVHGAGALIQSMHAVGEFDNSYLSYRDSGVNWLLRQVREFPRRRSYMAAEPLGAEETPHLSSNDHRKHQLHCNRPDESL